MPKSRWERFDGACTMSGTSCAEPSSRQECMPSSGEPTSTVDSALRLPVADVDAGSVAAGTASPLRESSTRPVSERA